ncbi:hypothetical protein [Sphingobium sp. CFD-2]|uniref:hypothetical protein n=1 Tax=Sphingobium sp. CFD-2 TaxID=2878542 RepID=UPI00214BA32B|nr:hypothetical protein [Sphingobium sp. CFD-2]
MKRILSLLLALVLAVPSFAAETPLVIQSGQIKKLPSATALQLNAPTTANSSLNLPHGTAPTSPNDGDCWTTTAGLYCRISGATVGPYATGLSSIAADSVVGNFTGSSAVPTSGAVPSCSSAGYALTYNTGTHAFGCSAIGLSAIAADSILANLTGSSAVPTAATLPSCSGSNDALYYDTTTHTLGCHAPSGAGGGTVTSVATSGLVTGGTITGSGTISLSSISAGYVVGNSTGSSAVPTASTLSALIDQAIGSTQGQILYRGASAWSALSPGTSGQVLTTGGVGANPSWAASGGSSSEASFTAPPTASNWTQQNFDATKTHLADFSSPVTGVRIYEDIYAYGNSNILRAALRPIAGTHWQVTARLRRHTRVTSYMAWGLVVRDSASSKSVILGFDWEAGGVGGVRMTNDTTYSAFISFGGNQIPYPSDIWMRLKYDGTDCNMYHSYDGVYWTRTASYAGTALWGFLTNAATHVGFGYNANNSGGTDLGQEVDLLSWSEQSLP